jgi:hypothetical protein
MVGGPQTARARPRCAHAACLARELGYLTSSLAYATPNASIRWARFCRAHGCFVLSAVVVPGAQAPTERNANSDRLHQTAATASAQQSQRRGPRSLQRSVPLRAPRRAWSSTLSVCIRRACCILQARTELQRTAARTGARTGRPQACTIARSDHVPTSRGVGNSLRDTKTIPARVHGSPAAQAGT